MSLLCLSGLLFAMILDTHVHVDNGVKCCWQVKMDSSVESELRNGISGGLFHW